MPPNRSTVPTTLRKYVPSPTAQKFHNSDAFIRFIMGPVGSGKSVACIQEVMSRAFEQPPTADGVRKFRAVFIRNSFPMLISTTLATFLDWYPEGLIKLQRSPVLKATLDQQLADGTRIFCEIIFLSLDAEADVGKLKSLEVSMVFMNESSEMIKEILDVASTRVGRYPSKDECPNGYSGICLDSNPPSTGHWLYELFVKQLPKNHAFFHQPPGMLIKEGTGVVRDGVEIPVEFIPNEGQRHGIPPAENIEHLPKGFQYYTDISQGKRLDWVRSYVLGEWSMITAGKPVFPEYRDSYHASKEPLEIYPRLPILIGLDFGRCPTAIISQMNAFGQLRILRELTSEDMGLQQFILEMLRPSLQKEFLHNPVICVGDPAGSGQGEHNNDTCEGIMRRFGFNYVPASTNAPVARIAAVSSFLLSTVDGKPGMIIDPSCLILREGLAGAYHYKKLKTALGTKFSDRPDKNSYSHSADALQYLCLWHNSYDLNKSDPMMQGQDVIKKRPVISSNPSGWC